MLGFDGCSPEQVYRHTDELPNMKRIMDAGGYGINKSVIPPITPHAWTTIFSGKNPGAFGYWDFQYRSSYTYVEDQRATSTTCKEPRLHNILPKHNIKMGMASVPLSSPPFQKCVCVATSLRSRGAALELFRSIAPNFRSVDGLIRKQVSSRHSP